MGGGGGRGDIEGRLELEKIYLLHINIKIINNNIKIILFIDIFIKF